MGAKTAQNKEKAIGCVLPHAGYVYSGKVAVETLNCIEIPSACIIMGPNHTGHGAPASIMDEGAWETPLGKMEINEKLAGLLLKNSKYLERDVVAHASEHSVEVMLPLIQTLWDKAKTFVPIVLATTKELVYKDIARSIAASIKGSKERVLIIASSDMSHYEPQEQANEKDHRAIEAMLALDDEELIKRVEQYDISMCGYIPAAIAVLASKLLGATRAKLASYCTSADASGDYSSVVGYAGIAIY